MSGSAQASLSTEEGHPTSPSRNSICPVFRQNIKHLNLKSRRRHLCEMYAHLSGSQILKTKNIPTSFRPHKRMESAAATDKDWHVFLELLIWIRMRFNILLNFLNFCLDDKNMTHHPILLLKIFLSILPETCKLFEM